MRSRRSGPVSAALLTVPLLLGVAGAPSMRVALPGTVPAWAAPAADRGEVAAASPVTVRVYLAGRERSGLAALAKAVSDPRSRSYRHFLTPEQVRRRFGAAPGEAAGVRSWLASAGFEVAAATPRYLSVRGDADAVRRAFGIRLHSYRKDGRTFRAPAAPATVPASVASAVLSVTGLDDAPHISRPSLRPEGREHPDDREPLPPPGPATADSGPTSAYFGEKPAAGTPAAYGGVRPYVLRGYTGSELRRAYGASGTALTGLGATVAVVDAYDSPTLSQDLVQYAARHGDAPYRPGQLTRVAPVGWTHTAPYDPVHAPDGCGAAGWYGEQTLDLEAVHGVAPGADLVYSAAASCADDDLADALDRIVGRRLADIVSSSWGQAESESSPAADPVFDDILMRGAVEGIGFYAATGDDGDFADRVKAGAQTGMPASLPWVTAVGGTSLATDSRGDYRFETGWGTARSPLSRNGTAWTGGLPGAFSSGGGGGTSRRVDQPSYQRGVVPPALAAAHGGRHRVVPDVAAVADPGTGFLVGQTQTWPDHGVRYGEYRVGGTSLATPVFAAVQALAQQADGGRPLGFANPALYQRYGTAAYHDVTDTPLGPDTVLAMVRTDFHNGVDADGGLDTSLRTMGHDSSLHAVAGFDDVTGLGSPASGYLASFRPPAR